MTTEFSIREASWQQDLARLRGVREQVFVDEQQVPVDLEWDGLDDSARHWLAFDAHGKAVGTARLLRDGHIGRMAVLADYRHKGIGGALLEAIMQAAKQAGMPALFLNAQVSAIGFYEKYGFRAEGNIFDDAGMPHRRMQRTL